MQPHEGRLRPPGTRLAPHLPQPHPPCRGSWGRARSEVPQHLPSNPRVTKRRDPVPNYKHTGRRCERDLCPPHPAVRGHPHPAAPSGPHKHLQAAQSLHGKAPGAPRRQSRGEPPGPHRTHPSLSEHTSAQDVHSPKGNRPGTSPSTSARGHGRDRRASRSNAAEPRHLGSPGALLAAGADRRTLGHRLCKPQSTVSRRKATIQECSGRSRLCSHLPVGVPTLRAPSSTRSWSWGSARGPGTAGAWRRPCSQHRASHRGAHAALRGTERYHRLSRGCRAVCRGDVGPSVWLRPDTLPPAARAPRAAHPRALTASRLSQVQKSPLAAARPGTLQQCHTRGTEPGRGSPGRARPGRGRGSPSGACGR